MFIKKRKSFRKSINLFNRASKSIPLATQTFSKSYLQWPKEIAPLFFERGKGCYVYDVDGNKYIDYLLALMPIVLGYSDLDVDRQVKKQMKSGVVLSMSHPVELELAEKLISIIPYAEMVRFGKNGSDALTAAVRLARAYTKRDRVLFSGYHGWTDWYLAANLADDSGLDGQLMPGLEPNGVPRDLTGTAIPFHFNDIDSLRETIRGKESEIAAIMIEPARGDEAPEEYLRILRDIASEIGAILIYDEITSGFRMCEGGIHRRYNINPDIAVFAKSMANGYAMSAILGKEEVMQAAQSTFISSTNWTDRVGPAAALATLKKYQKSHTDKHIISIGKKTQEIWKNAALKNKLDIEVSGLPSLSSFTFKSEHAIEMNTRFVVEMLQKGFLGFRQFKPSLAHSQNELKSYKNAVEDVFKILSMLPEDKILNSEKAHTTFKRLTKE